MKQSNVAILDFGSSKITCMIASNLSDGFVIKAVGEARYGGFGEATWYEPEKLKESIAFAINQAQSKTGERIKRLFVGVPGEFTAVAISEASLTFRSKKKIDGNDVDEIFNKADLYKDITGYLPITRSSIYYFVDENTKLFDPIGIVSNKLTGVVSFSFMSNYFYKSVDNALNSIGIDKSEYISNCLAEALYLIEPQIRDRTAILFDIGFITSNVMLVGGEGLMFLKSFSLGSGHISADLSEVLSIAYPIAEQLLSKINLNLEFQEADLYMLKDGITVSAEKANLVAKARIEEIAECIKACFADYEYEISAETPIYLTGGGLTYIKGGAEYLSQCLNKRVKIIPLNNPQTNKQDYVSTYGLLDIALRQQPKKESKFRFFK